MNRAILSQKINGELIDRLKNDPKAFSSFIQNHNDGIIIYVLEKLGRLENGYSKEPLLNLLNHVNENIRALSIKNLAKLEDINLLSTFIKYANTDESTSVRREAVSAIGRLRNEKAIPILIALLKDRDPKVVMQAIRGLLVFSYKENVKNELKKLLNHPNELIREVINKEINGVQYQSKDRQKHDESPEFLRNIDWEQKFLNKIVCGDSLLLLQEIPDKSIHLVITSPPYFQQRDYDGLGIGNENKVEEYIDNLLKIFNECVRITKDDGSIVFNLGDKYENSSLLMIPYKFAIEAIKKNPVKLVNIITWVKLNPTPRQFKRRLVNSTEPFFHFVKNDTYYYDINSFMNYKNSLRSKNNVGDKIGKSYFELIDKSSLSEEEKQQAKKELLEVIQEVKSGKIESFRMKIRGMHSEPFGGQEGGRKIQLEKKGFTIIKILGNGLKKDVIECPVETIKGTKHPAIYPEYIIQELIKLLTRKGDIVLDPFIGSGTTAVAAKKLDRNYIGIDINPSYCKYAESRLKNISKENNLFEFFI